MNEWHDISELDDYKEYYEYSDFVVWYEYTDEKGCYYGKIKDVAHGMKNIPPNAEQFFIIPAIK